jgi:hypothetical protein
MLWWSVRKKRKRSDDMTGLHQVKEKEEHKIKQLFIKKETKETRRIKPNKMVIKVGNYGGDG